MRSQLLLSRAQTLRREQTAPEQRLWRELRGKRFKGSDFRRQVVIGSYIVDFSCRAARLVVEVDGETHVDHETYDAKRTSFLEEQGYSVLRFTNEEVMRNLEGVLTALRVALTPPLPRRSAAFPLPASGERA